MFIILPDGVKDEINRRVDAFLEDHPDREIDRDELYDEMIQFFGHRGQIPEITLREQTNEQA